MNMESLRRVFMKHSRFLVFVLLLVMTISVIGCGGADDQNNNSTEDTDSTDETSKVENVVNHKLPVEGFVGQFDGENNSFVLATLPKSEGQAPGQISINFDNGISLVDLDGVDTTIKDYDRVRIDEGETTSSGITATKITLLKSSKASEYAKLISDNKISTMGSDDYLSVPSILKSSIGADLPKSFPGAAAWTVHLPKDHPTIKGAKIIELVSGNWSIYLLSNPETEEKYSVTITDRNEFEWTGIITEDDKVEQR